MKKMLPLKYQMRKKEWEIQDRNNMEQLLARVKVGRMGLYDGEEPYIVPVLFATKTIKSIFILLQREERLKS